MQEKHKHCVLECTHSSGQQQQSRKKTAIVARFLSSYNVDIAALSETRFAWNGFLEEVGRGFTFYWIGKAEDEPHQAGVGFAIRSDIAKNLESLPVGVSARLMTLRIAIDKENYATLISAYAPTMSNPDINKESFYSELRTALRRIPPKDKMIILGDFNARVGCENLLPNVLGAHGIGNMNSNGLILLSLCSEFSLTITNTHFKHAN